MQRFRTLDDLDVAGKRVLVRADLNVPVKDGKVTDATRIERLAPTIEALIAEGAQVVVMSHFGRPKGKPDPAHSLRPLVEPLAQAIGGRKVQLRAGLHRPGGRAGRRRAAARRGRAAGEPALPPRGGEERSRLRQATGGARRRLCRRCVLRGAPRARFDRGAGASAAGRGRQADAGRARGAGRGAGKPAAAGHRAGRRRQGARPSSICCNFITGKVDVLAIGGGDGEHVPVRAGQAGRPLAVRARHGRHCARRSWPQAKERGCEIILPDDAVTAESSKPGW